MDKQAESCYACHLADQALERLTIPECTRTFNAKENEKNLGIINPIYNEPGCWQASCHAHQVQQKVLGVLDVTMSLWKVEEQINAEQAKLALFALSAIVAISVMLWFLVQKFVGKPVSQLVEATGNAAAGHLNYRIKVVTNDEMGHLSDSFNEMTQKLAEAQRQLVQSDKLALLGRFAAGVAHEINNPLTGVLTYSSYLLKRVDFDGEKKKAQEVIVRETKRCREIVKDLLDFARQNPSKKIDCNVIQIILMISGSTVKFVIMKKKHRFWPRRVPIVITPRQQILRMKL